MGNGGDQIRASTKKENTHNDVHTYFLNFSPFPFLCYRLPQLTNQPARPLAVLKNVGKIERFVLEQMRKFITEDFVYPSYHSVKLERASTKPGSPSSPPPPSGSAPNNTPETSRNHLTPTTSSSVMGSTPSVGSHTSSRAGPSSVGTGYDAYSTSMRARSNTQSSFLNQRHQ